jgi:RimJ/RimL family protein N-acetyltransferase
MIFYDTKIFLSADIPLNARLWRNDRAIFDTCRQFTVIDQNHHLKWMEKISNSSIKMFGIYDKKNEFPLGVCGFTDINMQARHAEISIYIQKDEQGKGYAKDTLYTLIKHGFEDFNFNKLWGECFNTNLKSIMIFKKLGFIASSGHIQHYFRNGNYIDTTFMTLLEKDFKDVDQVYRRNIGESQSGIDEST